MCIFNASETAKISCTSKLEAVEVHAEIIITHNVVNLVQGYISNAL